MKFLKNQRKKTGLKFKHKLSCCVPGGSEGRRGRGHRLQDGPEVLGAHEGAGGGERVRT